MERLPFANRISTKILITLTVVSTLSVMATGTVLVTLSGRTLRRNISERNLQIARRASNEISLYIEDAITEVRAIADVLAAVRDPWVQDILLENLVVTFSRFQSISLVTVSGRLIASSSLGKQMDHRLDPQALSRAVSGNTYLSPVGLTSEQLPYLTIAVPATTSGPSPHALVAELALRDIWELVDDISFGPHGEALLISRDGILIAHPDKARVMNEAYRFRNPCGKGSLPTEGVVSTAQSNGSGGLLVASAPVKGLQWCMVVQQPLREAYLPIKSVLLRSFLLLAAMLTVVTLASLFLARLFSTPLNLLLAGTYRIGRGDLDHRMNMPRKDEIGRLSAAFDRMVEDLRQWSRRLTESEERYRLMAESIQDLIFSLDRKGRILFANRSTQVVSGYTLEELLGRDCLELLSENSREETQQRFREALPKNMRQGFELEVELLTRKEKKRIMAVQLVQVFNSSKQLQFFGVARDITQRKEAEQKLLEYQHQLRSLASELSLTEARERKRIAADLHDRIGQALALTRIKLGTLKAEAHSAAKITSIEETIRLVEVTINEVRSLIFDLSSPLLYEVGLKAAVEQLVEHLQNQHGTPISVEDDGREKPLTIDGSVVLFQATRELLLNVVKHAAAHRVRVCMSRRDNVVEITVQDDGVGFHVSRKAGRPGRQGGYGLFSIRERLEYLGGKMTVESIPGRGTTAALALALNHDTIESGG